MTSAEIRYAADAMLKCADELRAAGIIKFRVGEVEIVLGPKPPEKKPSLEGDDEPRRPQMYDAPADPLMDGATFPGGREPRRRKVRSSSP